MQPIDNKEVGDRLSEIMRINRVKSTRAFALSVGADPSFFAKIVKGERPLTESIGNEVAEKYGVSLDWLIEGVGEMKPAKIANAGTSFTQPTAMNILATLAEAFKDQARVVAVQADIMKSIESKMARADALATIDTNLIRTLAGVERIAIVQDRSQIELLNYLAALNAGKDLPSRGEDRKKHRTDGDGQKRGKNPA